MTQAQEQTARIRSANMDAATAGFHSTENYFRVSPIFRASLEGQPVNLCYTDGVKYVAETAGAYWLIDVIFSQVVAIYKNQKIPTERKEFLVCKLAVKDDDSAVFTITDGDDNQLARQAIEFTDFPAYEFTAWVEGGICLLPSEH